MKNFNFNFCCCICHHITFNCAQKFQIQFFFFDHVPMDPFVVANSNQNVESIVLVVDSTQIEVDLAIVKIN